jgi:hypothetical protein
MAMACFTAYVEPVISAAFDWPTNRYVGMAPTLPRRKHFTIAGYTVIFSSLRFISISEGWLDIPGFFWLYPYHFWIKSLCKARLWSEIFSPVGYEAV